MRQEEDVMYMRDLVRVSEMKLEPALGLSSSPSRLLHFKPEFSFLYISFDLINSMRNVRLGIAP